MTNIAQLIQELREERDSRRGELDALDRAIGALTAENQATEAIIPSQRLLNRISKWQKRACSIAPPRASNLSRPRSVFKGRAYPGVAFFPVGCGLACPQDPPQRLSIVVVGQDWGSAAYLKSFAAALPQEEASPTLAGTRRLIRDAGECWDSCFLTNWFYGIRPGNLNDGEFPFGSATALDRKRYEADCINLLRDQLLFLRPVAVLLLGLEVAKRAHKLLEVPRHWADAVSYSALDRGAGAFSLNVKILESSLTTNVCVATHASRYPVNDRHRSYRSSDLVRMAVGTRHQRLG